jgi:hypothetical protein
MPKLATTAEQILGQICIRWAWIEQSIDDLIAELVHLNPDLGRSITNNADIRAKIKMLKALAHLKKPSEEWHEFMVETLDYIDNILRLYRSMPSAIRAGPGNLDRGIGGVSA